MHGSNSKLIRTMPTADVHMKLCSRSTADCFWKVTVFAIMLTASMARGIYRQPLYALNLYYPLNLR